MKRALLSAAFAIACIAGLPAQDKPNFAGTWKSPESFTQWLIAVEGSRMTVTRTIAGNSESTVYMLDGTPSKNPIEGPNGLMDRVFTSTWEGDVLVTTMTTGGPNAMVERRWLEPDGTMKFNTTIVIQGKPQTSPTQGLTKIK
ncbi:MAG: hypothetical protein M3Q55_13830 [Acidobacteriota bacterium]|nr:hypothetical protein [Acidobacteriota bacterium]